MNIATVTDLDTYNLRDDALLESTTRFLLAAYLKHSNMCGQSFSGGHNRVLSEVYRYNTTMYNLKLNVRLPFIF